MPNVGGLNTYGEGCGALVSSVYWIMRDLHCNGYTHSIERIELRMLTFGCTSSGLDVLLWKH